MNVFLNEAVANNYDSFYETSSGIEIDKIEKQAIGSFLKDIPKGQFLELGCGTGHWTEFLTLQGFKVTAIDISDAMLSIAKAKNINGASFQKADASNLPFNNESFEVIVSIAMLEFVNNFQDVLAEIYRVIKPGGCLILGCLNINSILGKTKDNDETFRNAHFFSKNEITKALSDFKDVAIKECIYLNSSFEILDNSTTNYPLEGAFLAVSAKKKN